MPVDVHPNPLTSLSISDVDVSSIDRRAVVVSGEFDVPAVGVGSTVGLNSTGQVLVVFVKYSSSSVRSCVACSSSSVQLFSILI